MDKKKASGAPPKKPNTRREKRNRNEMEAAAAAEVASSVNAAGETMTMSTAASAPPAPPESYQSKNIANPFLNGFFPKGTKLVGVSKSGKKYTFSTTPQGAVPLPSSSKSAPPPPLPIPDEKVWSKVMLHLSRCTSAEGIRASSYYSTSGKTPANASSTSRNSCLHRLLQELVALEDDLPATTPNIWLRYDEETPQYLRCIITAPQGTPYALGEWTIGFDFLIARYYRLSHALLS